MQKRGQESKLKMTFNIKEEKEIDLNQQGKKDISLKKGEQKLP